jgi:hypothetical protein
VEGKTSVNKVEPKPKNAQIHSVMTGDEIGLASADQMFTNGHQPDIQQTHRQSQTRKA